MDIQFLERDKIDPGKWDRCVDQSANGNPYGFSWYLDGSSRRWSGLVEGDYESVFPLVWNRKFFGLKQLYRPYFCQQLGIYSAHGLGESRVKAFLHSIPREFRFIRTPLNEHTIVPVGWGFKVSRHSNCLLSLEEPYENLCRNYSSSLKRGLKKAAKSKLSLTDSVTPERLLDLYRTYQGPKISGANDQVYLMGLRIMNGALARGRGFLKGVVDSSSNLVAAGFFLKSHDRVINLIPSATDEGRKLHAMHFLLDRILHMHADQPVLLDFEGSAVPSIARFFKSFGSSEVPFYQVSRLNLPFGLGWPRSG